MARSSPFLLIVLALLPAGCQQQQLRRVPLPAPNFDGPLVLLPPAIPDAPAPSAPPAVRPSPPQVPADWVPPVAPNAWRWIVIHHSATATGSAAIFDREHRNKGWDELGYHFVIGNGTGSADGQIEVGSRWTRQKWGAHAKTPDNRFNDYGIGICLVGNFEIGQPTPAQLQSLNRLLLYLMQTYRIPPARVLGHGETKPTDCPGRNLRLEDVRRTMTALLEQNGANTTAAGADQELLRSVSR